MLSNKLKCFKGSGEETASVSSQKWGDLRGNKVQKAQQSNEQLRCPLSGAAGPLLSVCFVAEVEQEVTCIQPLILPPRLGMEVLCPAS